MIGQSLPAKRLQTSVPLWEWDLETPKNLLYLMDHLSKWEGHLSNTQQISAERVVQEGLFPVLNLHLMT